MNNKKQKSRRDQLWELSRRTNLSEGSLSRLSDERLKYYFNQSASYRSKALICASLVAGAINGVMTVMLMAKSNEMGLITLAAVMGCGLAVWDSLNAREHNQHLASKITDELVRDKAPQPA